MQNISNGLDRNPGEGGHSRDNAIQGRPKSGQGPPMFFSECIFDTHVYKIFKKFCPLFYSKTAFFEILAAILDFVVYVIFDHGTSHRGCTNDSIKFTNA